MTTTMMIELYFYDVRFTVEKNYKQETLKKWNYAAHVLPGRKKRT